MRSFWRRIFLNVAVGGFVVFLVSGAGLVALGFFFYGVATGLGDVLERPWLGYVVVGGGMSGALSFLISWARRKYRRYEIEKTSHKNIPREVPSLKEDSHPSVQQWAQEHPWKATGAATIFGFVAATVLRSPKTRAFLAAYGTGITKQVLRYALTEILRVNLQHRRQHAHESRAQQETDHTEYFQSSKNAQK